MDGCGFFHFGLATVETGKVAIRQGEREGARGRIAATIHIDVRALGRSAINATLVENSRNDTVDLRELPW